MVDYGPKQVRIDLPTQKSSAEADELSRTLADIVRTPERLRWTFD